MRSLTITVPMCPPSELLPNNRRTTHWGTISKHTKALRKKAKQVAQEQRPADWVAITGPFTLDLYVGYGRRRVVPDLDASANACKAAIDALADAFIFNDDKQMDELRVRHGKDPSGEGFICLTITEA